MSGQQELPLRVDLELESGRDQPEAGGQSQGPGEGRSVQLEQHSDSHCPGVYSKHRSSLGILINAHHLYLYWLMVFLELLNRDNM